MKIVICGSMTFSNEMLKAKQLLNESGHEVVLPQHTEEYVLLGSDDHVHNESMCNKINEDLIRHHFNEIQNGDAILVINEPKNNVPHYIGGNSFLEMGFAHVLNKKIYLLHAIPEVSYRDELLAMQPIELNGDLSALS